MAADCVAAEAAIPAGRTEVWRDEGEDSLLVKTKVWRDEGEDSLLARAEEYQSEGEVGDLTVATTEEWQNGGEVGATCAESERAARATAEGRKRAVLAENGWLLWQPTFSGTSSAAR